MLILLPHPFTVPVIGNYAEIIPTLDGVIGESQKEVLKLFGKFGSKFGANRTPFAVLDEHTKKEDIPFLAEPILKGETWGYMSDAGLPCLADPGAELVLYLRSKGVEIKALPAPSPIFYALMLSGLPAQKFFFHGYLPRDKRDLKDMLLSFEDGITHYFIEAPYRNLATFESILQTLKPKTLLSLATALFTPEEKVTTKNIHDWRNSEIPLIEDLPTVFLIAQKIQK